VDGSPARTPARFGFARESRDGEKCERMREQRRGRRNALRIATRTASWPVSGLARRVDDPGRGAFPCECTVADALACALTVAGAAPECDRDATGHRLPVSTSPQEHDEVTSKRRAV